MLGGPGCVVEIDESLITKAKPTRNAHARPVEETWIFGLFNRVRKIGFIQFVTDRVRVRERAVAHRDKRSFGFPMNAKCRQFIR